MRSPRQVHPKLRQTFAALGSHNYRLFFFGQLISVSGTWMQTVAQSFLVLHLTNSGTALGFVTAARFGPLFLLGPWGGVVADRHDKRRILYLTQALSGLLALTFGILVQTHSIQMWTVYVLATCLGLVNVFDNPARQALIPQLVPEEQLLNAVTLNSVMMNLARILGAAAGGVITTILGLALCFDLNAASFGAVVVMLVLMADSQITKTVLATAKRGQVREGVRYVRESPEILVPLVMILIIGMLAWEFQISLPLLASTTFNGNAATYAAMASVMGAGAVVGGLVSASRTRLRVTDLSKAAVGWGIAICLAALAPTLISEYVVLLFVGYGSITFNSLAKTSLQLASAAEMRGRVMALWSLAWQGSTPIGGPIIGWISQEFGARWSLLAGGLPTIAVGIAAFPLLLRSERTSVQVSALEPAESEAL